MQHQRPRPNPPPELWRLIRKFDQAERDRHNHAFALEATVRLRAESWRASP